MEKFQNKSNKKLEEILSKVGDMFFKRRILKMFNYLEVKSTDNILDAGCGEGFYELIFKELYDCKVTGVDINQELIDLARKHIGNNKKIKFEVQDVRKLPYKNNTFDKIICTEVLEHIEDDEAVAKELYRVLKPGGVLAVTVPNENYPFFWDPLNNVREMLGFGHFNSKSRFLGGIWSYDHKRLYSPLAIRELLGESGFKPTRVEVITKYGLPFNLLILNLGKTLYTQLPVGENVKIEMEKFDWNRKNVDDPGHTAKIIGAGFSLIKWVDKYNDQTFDLEEPTMGICLRCTK